MKIISWNVAGFRAILKKGFKDLFYEMDADVFCVQEVKAFKNQIEFDAENYYEFLNPAEKPGYSGTMVYTKVKPISVTFGMDKYIKDSEGRIITLEYENFYLITVYVPNVKEDLSRLPFRLAWEDYFLMYIKDLESIKPVIICGDFNVAHTEMDIKRPVSNVGKAGFTIEERERFTKLLDYGLIDTFRYLNPNVVDAYTWWSYVTFARVKNDGWRIDYFLISKSLKEKLKKSIIYKEIMGSDHCPIGMEIEL